MKQQRIEIVQEFSKPLAQVFAFLADHNNLGKVFGVPVKRIRDGVDDVNGVGSVRALGFAPLATEETVMVLVPNDTIEYTITKNGGPLMNHYGIVKFYEFGTGSRLHWTITFDSLPLVGPLMKKILETGIRRGLQKI